MTDAGPLLWTPVSRSVESYSGSRAAMSDARRVRAPARLRI